MDIVFIIDIVGWIGAICLLSAYMLTTRIPGTSDTLRFHFLNLAGGVCFATNAYYYDTLPITVLNVIWVFLGLYAVYRIVKKPKPSS